MSTKYVYERINLYFSPETSEAHDMAYTFLKSLGRNQTEFVARLVKDFIGDDADKVYPGMPKSEAHALIARHAQNPGAYINRGFSDKEPTIHKEIEAAFPEESTKKHSGSFKKKKNENTPVYPTTRVAEIIPDDDIILPDIEDLGLGFDPADDGMADNRNREFDFSEEENVESNMVPAF